LLLVSGLLVLTSRARAQAPAAVNVSVDATAVGTPLEQVWPFYGYDEINYTTLPEGRALLGALASANSAPVHVRNHFLFNTGDGEPALKWGSTNVYTEDAAGNPIYSWPLTDGIMDAITAAGAFPLVELGFMPQALSTHPTPYRNSSSTLLDGGSFYPPTDYNKWGDLIHAWATHANGRYPDVSTSWLWELWNEPDIGYWNGSFDEYAKLYDYTESSLHDVVPAAQLGGPAVAGPGGSFLKQFLEHCATGSNAATGGVGARLDLVTFHAKGGVAITDGHVQMDLGNQLRLHRAGFNAVAAVSQFKNTPIYITEADPDGCAACPASDTPADAYRNSTAYGAYELAMMKHSIELENELGVTLGGILTWAFTFPGTPYFSGYRELASNGISLPVLSAFKLLGQLGGTRMPLNSDGALTVDAIMANGVQDQPDIDGIAASDGAAIRILVWNYHDDIVSVPATPVRVIVKVPASFGPSVRVAHLRVDESHGDAYTVWSSQGMPSPPSLAQVAALQAAMNPSALSADETLGVDSEGSVAVDFDLPRFGVSLLTLSPASNASTGPLQSGANASGCSCSVDRDNGSSLTALFGAAAAMSVGALRHRGRTRCRDAVRRRAVS
jgi:xylan 1,4-beta-xylosidase